MVSVLLRIVMKTEKMPGLSHVIATCSQGLIERGAREVDSQAVLHGTVNTAHIWEYHRMHRNLYTACLSTMISRVTGLREIWKLSNAVSISSPPCYCIIYKGSDLQCINVNAISFVDG